MNQRISWIYNPKPLVSSVSVTDIYTTQVLTGVYCTLSAMCRFICPHNSRGLFNFCFKFPFHREANGGKEMSSEQFETIRLELISGWAGSVVRSSQKF